MSICKIFIFYLGNELIIKQYYYWTTLETLLSLHTTGNVSERLAEKTSFAD